MNVHHKPEKTTEKAGKQAQPPQTQRRQPGRERAMSPSPQYQPKFPGVGKLKDKVAVITGGDSGIGRAVAVAMAREGALISILYLEEHDDADETIRLVEAEGSQAINRDLITDRLRVNLNRTAVGRRGSHGDRGLQARGN